jgi:hypothetical protein
MGDALLPTMSSSLEQQAKRMRQRAAARDGHDTIPVGTVVQLALDNVDRAKLDHTNATLVVVEHVGSESYRLANKAGVYQDVVSRAYLHPLAASPALVGLEHVVREWEGMPKVGIRKIAASLSIAGGQGLLHCACKGKCDNARCACFKAGRKCNSRCHKGSKACCNYD